MNRPHAIAVALPALALFTGCAAGRTLPGMNQVRTSGPILVSGLVGVTEIDDDSIDLADESVDVDDDGVETLPLIGAAWQIPFGGGRLNLGVETGFTFGWEGDRGRVTRNGTTVVRFDNDLFIADVFLGLSFSARLGRNFRLFGGLGPMVQFVDVDLEFEDEDDRDDLDRLSESGLGTGAYGRIGLEVLVTQDTWVGLVARKIDSTVDIGSGIDEFDVDAVQVMLSVTQSW